MHKFHAEKETETLAAARAKKRSAGKVTLDQAETREAEKRPRCTHDFVRVLPSGPRDNGEYRDICRLWHRPIWQTSW